MTYQSNESGRYEIYVRPFPAVDTGRWQISTDGGTRPHWSRDGRELFYLAQGEGQPLVTVPIAPGPSFAAGSPKVLFRGEYVTPSSGRGAFAPSADGTRFLMIKNADTAGAPAPQIIVVQHWLDELKRLVPTN